MSPLQLKVLLNIYYSPIWQDASYQQSESWLTYLEDFGIIEECKKEALEHPLTHGWVLTDKGMAWIQLILNVPMPKEAWIDQNGQVIKIEV